MRWTLMILGGLMVLMGGTWLLQGVGILPGQLHDGAGLLGGSGGDRARRGGGAVLTRCAP